MKIRGINYNLGYGGNVTPFSYSEKLEHIKFISEMLNANSVVGHKVHDLRPDLE